MLGLVGVALGWGLSSAMMGGFAKYLGAPANTCRVGPPGYEDGCGEGVPPGRSCGVAELRDDGRFAGSVVVYEHAPVLGQPPIGLQLRFTFYVRIDGDRYVVQSGDSEPGKEFRIKDLDVTGLSGFFDHVFDGAFEFFTNEPEKIVGDKLMRPIGFTAW